MIDQHAQKLPVPQAAENASLMTTYHRIVILTEGASTPFLAKTAISLLRYRTDDVAAVLDAGEAGRTAQDLLSAGGDIPVIGSLDDVQADALFIGIAPPGGKIPPPWREIIADALRRGIDVVSGLHDFVGDDPEFVATAERHNCRLIDVRRNSDKETARHVAFREGCLRIHSVGHDCSIGKMVVALEVQRGLSARGHDAKFLATGQTGIMISGEGVPLDCVVADFVNGSAERLVERNQHHDFLLIEGQGSITHPAFSAVTLGLLHGSAPDGLFLCYEVGRDAVKSLEHVPTQPLAKLLELYEAIASVRHPCRVIGVAMNSRTLTVEEASQERHRVEEELGLPVCDVYRDGPDVLVDAVLKLREELMS